MRSFILKYPALMFIVLAFGWAWGWWLPVAGTDLSDISNAGPMFFVCAMMGGFGPTIGGLVVRFTMDKEHRPKLLAKPSIWLFVLSLLLVPAVTALSLLAKQLLGIPDNVSGILSRLAIGLVWPLMASLGEEFGWRGLLLPLWSKDGGYWKPAIGIGLLWGLWHLPSDWIGLRELGWWFIPQYLLVGIVNLTLLSMIMTAIQQRGKGDIRLAVVFHYTITACAILLGAQGNLEPARAVLSSAVSMAVMAVATGVVVWVLRRTRV